MKHSTKLKNNKRELQKNGDVDEDVAMETVEIPGEIVQTLTVPRGPVSTIHTQMDYLHPEMVRTKKHFVTTFVTLCSSPPFIKPPLLQ